MSRAAGAPRPDEAGFSWAQFRVLLFAIRKGEERVDSSGMGLSGDGGSRALSRLGTLGRRALIAVALLVLGGFFFVMGMGAGVMGASPYAVFSLSVVALVITTVLVGLYQAVNTLYFVRDLGYYLTLPLSPASVMWAKLAHFLAGVLVGDLIFLPMGLGCLMARSAPVGAYVAATVAFLLCALAVNLALTIACVALMRFSRLAHDRDRFSRVFGALIMVLALCIGVGSQLVVRAEDAIAGVADGAAGVVSGGPGMLALGVLCPPWLASRLALSDAPLEALGGLVAMAALVAVYALVLNACAGRWYFEGVRALQGAGEKGVRRLDASDLRKATGARGAFAANLSRDWKTVVRTPVFFNQCVLGLVLMPLYFVAIIAVSLVVGSSEGGFELAQLIELAPLFTSQLALDSSLLSGCALGTLGIAVLMGISSYPFTMAVSRDGEDFFFLRALPMDWRAYLASKYVPTAALSCVPVAALLAVAAALLRVPPVAAAYLLLVYVGATASVGLLSLGVGAWFPRLHWDNETQLFKGGQSSLLVLAGMLVAAVVLLAPGAVVAMPFISPGFDVATALLAGLALQLVECAGLAWWVFGPTARSLSRREP